MKILVTGCAGFIGYHVCMKLISENHKVIGVDNITPYYDTCWKYGRLVKLQGKIEDYRTDISNFNALERLFNKYEFDMVIHLAAEAGVRNSIDNPLSYIQTNIVGFSHILDLCRNYKVKRLVLASSSSVYGDWHFDKMSEDACADKPISVYAATKRADELLAYSYSHLYGIKTTILRFFTVYGEYGRPDMVYWKFTDDLLNNRKITFNNYGDIYRDFTYIGDLVERIYQIVSDENVDLFKIYNIGSGNSIRITEFANELFNQMLALKMIDREFIDFKLAPMQEGDVIKTLADTSKLEKDYGVKPITPLAIGLRNFLTWYKSYILDK